MPLLVVVPLLPLPLVLMQLACEALLMLTELPAELPACISLLKCCWMSGASSA